MKLKFLTLLLVLLTTLSYSQKSFQIGSVQDGPNKTLLKAIILNELGSGTIQGELNLQYSDDNRYFFVSAFIADNDSGINSIGFNGFVEDENLNLYSSENSGKEPPNSGITFKYTCAGSSCGSCHPKIDWHMGGWKPKVSCVCKDDDGGKCDMTVSFQIVLESPF